MDKRQSTCKDNKELFNASFFLGFICKVGVKLLTIVKSKIFPSISIR